MQYRNLINLRNEYKHLFLTEISILNKYYRLLSKINNANYNHYNTIIFNNMNTRNNLIENLSYLYMMGKN